MQTSALYDPITSATPEQRKIFQQTKERRDRIAQKAVVQAYVAPAEKVEPRSLEPVVAPKPTPEIEVKASNGQVVLVTQEQFAEAWAMFDTMGYEGSRPSIDCIMREVCKHFGISRVDLICSRRTKEVIKPRHVAIYLAKLLTIRSLPEISKRFGRRDHTTALSAFRKIERQRKSDADLDADIRAIIESINNSHALGGVLA